MKNIQINNKEGWKDFILREAKYPLPNECRGGLCVDAGCNIGDFEINYFDRFDKWICFDVFEENVKEAIKNTKGLGLDIQILKYAVWDVSDNWIPVMAYDIDNDIDYFGNSGNIGCIQNHNGKQGWKDENTIGLVPTISLGKIINEWGDINLLKVDVEGSEYPFLLGKDLSRVNWITMEVHGDNINELVEWIGRTHSVVVDNGNLKTWKRI